MFLACTTLPVNEYGAVPDPNHDVYLEHDVIEFSCNNSDHIFPGGQKTMKSKCLEGDWSIATIPRCEQGNVMYKLFT